MSQNNAFDPLADLLAAQFAKPERLRPIALADLTPFERALLAIDGTVTKFIEAYTMEAVEVVLVAQSTEALPADLEWLEAKAGTPVISRQVLLRGRERKNPYVYAASLLVEERLPRPIQEGLRRDRGGIGHVLLESRLETFREILWYGSECLEELPEPLHGLEGNEFISRTYRIIARGHPLMLITERFPLGGVTP